MIVILMVIGGICLGAWLQSIDAKQKRRGWKEYRPSTNPLRDFK